MTEHQAGPGAAAVTGTSSVEAGAQPCRTTRPDRTSRGGAAKYHEAAAARGKLFARDRIALLVDEGSFTEDGLFANAVAAACRPTAWSPAPATVDGRPVALMANDSTVKAGSWGARTVEKIIRIIEKAYRRRAAR